MLVARPMQSFGQICTLRVKRRRIKIQTLTEQTYGLYLITSIGMYASECEQEIGRVSNPIWYCCTFCRLAKRFVDVNP